MKCPRCGDECERPEIDIGVGSIGVGPYACESCHWVEGVTAEEQAELDADLKREATDE